MEIGISQAEIFSMQDTSKVENQFVVDLLTTLRNEKFSPLAWVRFLRHSWEMSCATAKANPTLKRSWARTTLIIGTLALAILVVSFIFDGPGRALRLMPGFLFCVAWQQSDLFWHLGLNRHVRTGKLLPVVGAANTLTWLRGLGASFLLGRLVGGINTPAWLALLVFLIGVITDILDGQIARRTQTQTKLGHIADGEADFYLYLAITFIFIQNIVLPLWLGVVMLLRFLIPLFAALSSYFLLSHPLRFGSTTWGKYAGLAQCLYFLVLLAPGRFASLAHIVNLPLLITTLILLIVAPLVQIVQNVPNNLIKKGEHL
jgi:phosphatidylglycerophosphate synthase